MFGFIRDLKKVFVFSCGLHFYDSFYMAHSVAGFLTIGIPSIKRINGINYLTQTLDSLIQSTTPDEQMLCVVVVFLADLDLRYNNNTLKNLTVAYSHYIDIGFIHVIQAYQEIYPDFMTLKRNFNDKPDRVKWRSKQAIDFAYMFSYAQNISKYYIQIEDDVRCAKGFAFFIKDYISKVDRSRKHWALLEFSELGFIGKLVRSSDLSKFSDYLLLFFDEQPVDWLLTSFRLSMAQRKQMMRKPTLFQHHGEISSFDISKKNDLKDRFFYDEHSTYFFQFVVFYIRDCYYMLYL